MTKEMYEDLLERNKLQISELNTLTEEQDKHIVELEKEKCELLGIIQGKDKVIQELKKDKEELCLLISKADKTCVYLNEKISKYKKLIDEYGLKEYKFERI